MKNVLFLMMALLICLMSFAGDIKHISITYDYISDSPNETPEQMALPRQLSYEDLMKWLARNQTSDENMVVRREVVTIRE